LELSRPETVLEVERPEAGNDRRSQAPRGGEAPLLDPKAIDEDSRPLRSYDDEPDGARRGALVCGTPTEGGEVMKKLLPYALALATVSATSGVAPAEEARADLVAAGHDFALKICSSCHVVAIDQTSSPLMNPPAPSFSEIAARPATTESSLRDFLAKPHGEARRSSKMPAFMLGDRQITQIIAYLASLKPGKEPAERR